MRRAILAILAPFLPMVANAATWAEHGYYQVNEADVLRTRYCGIRALVHHEDGSILRLLMRDSDRSALNVISPRASQR